MTEKGLSRRTFQTSVYAQINGTDLGLRIYRKTQ